MDQPLAAFTSLDPSPVRLFSKIGISKTSEMWTYEPSELAKKLKVTEVELQATLDVLCAEMAPKPRRVSEFPVNIPSHFTTGDMLLDKALNGGVRAGMVTEICGES
jgi:DNA repair protein RAD57